jgi:thiosulfate/3-mercaptopyruvate sulfurtransferase
MVKSIFINFFFITVILLVLTLPKRAQSENSTLQYISEIIFRNNQYLILDTRPIEKCKTQSLIGAHCLPAGDFLGPHGRLASFADIAWILGSAGLTGQESVLVVGKDPIKRDFVAGLIHIMGQARVTVLSKSLNLVKGSKGSGEERADTRTAIWQAIARDRTIVFKQEIRNLLKSFPRQIFIDGRPEESYWGETITASRGGHIPGADHLPAQQLRTNVIKGRALGPAVKNSIVYAQNSVDSIAFMTLVIAGTGTPVRVYTGGWAEWAADGSLPADAESFPMIKIPKMKGS